MTASRLLDNAIDLLLYLFDWPSQIITCCPVWGCLQCSTLKCFVSFILVLYQTLLLQCVFSVIPWKSVYGNILLNPPFKVIWPICLCSVAIPSCERPAPSNLGGLGGWGLVSTWMGDLGEARKPSELWAWMSGGDWKHWWHRLWLPHCCQSTPG